MSKPKLERLIKEIAMFDMDAACKLHQRKDKQNYNNSYDLDKTMIWRSEKEGDGYWYVINEKLKARRKNYHPHRDLMIEYANDKTIEIQVLIDGVWDGLLLTQFPGNLQYRKKPKFAKKVIEYRLYLDKENEIIMVERQDMIKPANFKGWLGGWQKVEIDVEQND